MGFFKKNYQIIVGIGLLIVLIIGVCITLIFMENKDKQPIDNENEVVKEEPQTNERDETVKQLEVITDYINIRSESSVNSTAIGKVYKGEIYTILEEVGTDFDWYLIETNTGIRGYIAGKSGEDVYVEVLLPANEKTEENNNTNNDKPNNNGTQNNTNQNNSNNTQQNNNAQSNNSQNDANQSDDTSDDNYEPQLPACLITSCAEGEELKNPNSTDCYCEKVSKVKPLNIVLYNKNGLTITATEFDPEFKSYGEAILLQVVNNSSEAKTVQPYIYSYVNDKQVPISFSVSTLPGTSATNEILFLDSYLQRADITEINKVMFKLKVIDWDGEGWPSDKKRDETDWITINI